MDKNEIKMQLELSEDWPEVKSLMETLLKKGFQAVLAGGAVRDALLKKPPKDMDIATSACPEEVLKLIPSAKGAFSKYGVVVIPLKTKKCVQVTSFRTDSLYKDGRRPEMISYSSMEEDAKRRDFTINALFYDLQKEQIIDFTGGLKDLRNKLVRTVGKAKKRFEEDHLRILRALRFAHQLDFQIDEETKTVISAFAPKVQKLSKERILEELVKMFSRGKMGLILKNLQDYGLFPYLFSDLESPLKAKHLKRPFVFWNQEFSFYKNQAFSWTVFGLPFFYSNTKQFNLFLKDLLVSSAYAKKSVSYLGALYHLTTDHSSLTEKLQALDGQKAELFELAYFWLKSQGREISSLNQILREFEQREKKGRLPKALVTGSDLLKFYPNLPREKFSFVLKQAFEYQMEHPKAKKTEILKKGF